MRGRVKWIVLITGMIAVIIICHRAGERLKHLILDERETSASVSETGSVIVLDPGHGGVDAGKIGINNAEEKEINLKISLKIKKLLEGNGITVVMTRTDDNRLADTQKEDLKERVRIMNEEQPALAVSIHQNSYQGAGVRGPQVFYYAGSKEGKTAAGILQEKLNQINPAYSRDEKENNSYYILKNTEVPVVIVECGFLSNADEAAELVSDEYQDAMAATVTEGIKQYIE